MDPAAARRGGVDGVGVARVLRREAGALQDSALRARRRRVPDDGHRQGAQGRDARAGGTAARGAGLTLLQSYYDSESPRYDRTRGGEARAAAAAAAILELLPSAARTVLDVAGGTGIV